MIERKTTATGREVIDTGRVLIGIRAGENAPPRASNDDELQMQDIVRGLRPSRVTESGHRIGVPAALLFAAAVLLYVLVVRA